MSHLSYYGYEGYGQKSKEIYGYSQAVKIGDRIECSGQGGWNRETLEISKDLATEFNQAFENVEAAVKSAGGKGWSDVYKLRSYICPGLTEEVTDLMVKNLKKWCGPDHQPLWTHLGVTSLGIPEMRIELEVEAHIQ